MLLNSNQSNITTSLNLTGVRSRAAALESPHAGAYTRVSRSRLDLRTFHLQTGQPQGACGECLQVMCNARADLVSSFVLILTMASCCLQAIFASDVACRVHCKISVCISHRSTLLVMQHCLSDAQPTVVQVRPLHVHMLDGGTP